MNLPPILDRKRLVLFLRLLISGLAQAGAVVVTTLLMRLVFDHVMRNGQAPGPVEAWAAIGLIGALIIGVWSRTRSRINAERMGQDYVVHLRLLMYDRLCTMPLRVLQSRSRGAMMLRFVGDLSAIHRWVSLGLARSVVAMLALATALALLGSLSPTLAIGVGIVLLFGGTWLGFTGRRMREVFRESRRQRSRLAANVNEKIASMAVVQVCGQWKRERHRMARQSRRLCEAMVDQVTVVANARSAMEATAAVGGIAVLLLGAQEVMAGRTTPGTVVAAMIIVRLLVPYLRDLGRIHEYYQTSRVSLQKIAEFLDIPGRIPDTSQAAELTPGPGCLEFRNVELTGILSDVTVTAEAGTVVAIVGPNGAGKSMLLSLAARLVDPNGGMILMDGKPLAEHGLDSLRRQVAMVSLDLPLLRGTVGRNLRYRWREAPDEELARIMALCGVEEVLTKLPKGMKTRVTEEGMNLSLGERQRIALARALLGNPSILLLDEVDANLDPRTRKILDRVLRSYRGTVLMVTHRKERVEQADMIWHVAEGRLVEAGPPAKLFSYRGPTSRLFESDRIRALCG